MTEDRRVLRRLARRAESLADALAEVDIDALPASIQDEVNEAWAQSTDAANNLRLAEEVMADDG